MNVRPSPIRALLSCITAAVVATACSASPTDLPPGDGSGAPSPGGDPAPASGATDDTPAALPFYASDEFVPSGYMGSGDGDVGAISMTSDANGCKTPRAAGAGGACYGVKWQSTGVGTPTGWAGVYWQFPANNWGAKAGRRVVPGARKVSFYAVGATGGELVTFKVGGVNAAGSDPALAHHDEFTVSLDATLTTTWTRYEIDLSSETYAEVIGGFAWVASAPVGTTVAFYVDDVRWEK